MTIINKPIHNTCQLILVLTLGCCMLLGCQKKAERIDLKESSITSEITVALNYYSPLDASRFSAIINDTQHFGSIFIYYRNPSATLKLSLDTSNLDNRFSDIELFQGELFQTGGIPPQSNVFSHDFSALEVQEIFDHISENSAYFFNGEEYEGLYPPPIETDSIYEPVCSDEYIFTLQILEPNQFDDSWTIHKCLDEYPDVGHPLYNLFEMLEVDFISQFE